MALFGRAPGVGLALALLLALCTLVAANVEKAVFVPSAGRGAERGNALDNDLGALDLPRLAPDADSNAWRTFLPALFPWSPGFPQNATTWIRLDRLVPGQRYELRVCWAATQPTEFLVDVYDAAAVLEAPELAAELLAASKPLVAGLSSSSSSSSSSVSSSIQPPTFARIVATADYITAPMSPNVPPVPVLTDIIIDPFLLNVLPRSLLPTVAAVLAVAAASAVLARRVVLPQLRQVAAAEKTQ